MDTGCTYIWKKANTFVPIWGRSKDIELVADEVLDSSPGMSWDSMAGGWC
jgi:hypothetical protein